MESTGHSITDVWATVWATTTGAVAKDSSGGNGSSGIYHLRVEQSVDGSNPSGGVSYSSGFQ